MAGLNVVVFLQFDGHDDLVPALVYSALWPVALAIVLSLPIWFAWRAGKYWGPWLIALLGLALPILLAIVASTPPGPTLGEIGRRWFFWILVLDGAMIGPCFWLLSEARPLHRRAFFLAVISIYALGLLAFAAWRVPYADHLQRQNHDWQSANASDCPVMAIAFKAFPLSEYDPHAKLGSNPLPLKGRTPSAGPCDWAVYGLHFTVVTDAKVAAGVRSEVESQDGYIEHYSLSRPNYSLLGLRAAVEVGHYYHTLDAYGGTCWLHRTLHGWQLEKCQRNWIA